MNWKCSRLKKIDMNYLSALLLLGVLNFSVAQEKFPHSITINKSKLIDKIKGGWAGQVIGVTFGGPTEFRFNGTMVNDYQPIPWYDGYIAETMTKQPGLYDDLYMDLTFVEVLENKGLDATAMDHAEAYAKAQY